MIRAVFIRAILVLAVWALFSGPAQAAAQPVGPQADVAEELWIRAAARRLVAEPGARPEMPAGTTDWQAEVAQLEAYARAGVWAPAALVEQDESDRVEVSAAKLRVLRSTPEAGGEFEERLVRGLRSPFGAERSSALHRAALWSLEVNAMDGRASRLFAQELLGGEVPEAVIEPLFELALRCGDGRRFESLLTLPVASQELESEDRGGWDPVLGFFGDIVALPLSLGELAGLGLAATEPGPLACVQLVARVRDGVDVEAPAVELIVPVITGHGKVQDDGELDAVAEILVDALMVPSRTSRSVSVRSLGEALLDEAVRPELAQASRERCLRSAARLLPVEVLLAQGLGLDEEAALEMWDTLDRRDDWPKSPSLTTALDLWITHGSVDVREAVVRAVGRRFAYAGHADLGRALVEVLADEDATLRSLCFAWLAKSPGDPGLDAELFAAWKREGHGGESPTLTERQGRWLGQLPRDRQASLYRGALLDLLSLEGSGREAVGAGSLELLRGFRGDAEVFQRVAILLERSLVGIGAKAGYVARLPFDASAARAVRILHSVDPVRAEPLVEDALRRSMDPMHGAQARGDARPQLPKTSVALLARTESGRVRLASLSSRALPRRVRFEVALQLVKRGFPAAGSAAPANSVDVLMGDFKGVDGALRLRAIEALGSAVLRHIERIDVFLMELTGVGNDEAERSMAIEALGRRGNVAGLVTILEAAIDGVGPDAGTIDAAANAARALRFAKLPEWDISGELNGRSPKRRSRALPAARAALAKLASPALAAPEERQLETVRGALLESLCAMVVSEEEVSRNGAVEWLSDNDVDQVLDAVLSAPLEAARLEATRQFQSGRRIESQFLWASELAALKTLRQVPVFFRLAIGEETRWGHLDGRTLLGLARVAQAADEGALARNLAVGAAVALAGEGAAPDLQRRLAEARWVSGGFGRSLLGSYRQGILPRGVLRAMLPSMQRPEVVLHQRYWAALAAAEVAAAGLDGVAASRAKAWLALD